ncbi:hypothetical protein GCM10009861_05960 [Neomicrococcus aestuarii]
MLVPGLSPLRIQLEHGSIGNAQLPGQGFHHRPRNSQWIRQKTSDYPHRDQLNSKSQAVVHSPAATNHRQIGIVQPTETFQVLRWYLVGESAEPCDLLIT